MDELENIYNKRFQDKELPNDDFDVEGLWDAVEAELEEGGLEKRGIAYKYWPLGVLLLVAVAVAFYFYTGAYSDQYNNGSATIAKTETTIETSEANQAKMAIEEAELKDVNPTSELSEEVNGSKSEAAALESHSFPNTTNTIDQQKIAKTKTGTKPTLSQSSNNSPLTEVVSGNQSRSVNEKNEKSTINNPITTSEQRGVEETRVESDLNIQEDVNNNRNTKEESATVDLTKATNDRDSFEDSSGSEIVESESNNKTTGEGNKEIAIDKSSAIPSSINEKETLEQNNNTNTIAWEALDLATADLDFPKTVPYDAEAINDKAITPVKKKNLSWEVEAYGGFNKVNADFLFLGDSIEQLNATYNEQGEYGSSYGLQIGMLWKNRWSLKVGAEYHTLWSQFKYDAERTQNIQKDTLKQVVFDPNSNSIVDSLYGNVLGTQTINRNVVHHNKYTMYSFPISLGWQANKNRFTYGLNAGVTLNFVSRQNGKSFNEEGILEYSSSENKEFVPFEDFHLGLRLSPQVGYRLTSKMTVRLMPQWNWYNGVGTVRVDGGVSSYGVNVGLGLRF